ncbi:MAG: hypothetical protein AAGD38_15275 [Acidobacteriota bacterium]
MDVRRSTARGKNSHEKRVWLAAMLIGVCVAATSHGQVVFTDGFESGDGTLWSDVVGYLPATAYRVTDLDLRDPHVFVDLGIGGCFDFTDNEIPLAGVSFNGELGEELNFDGDGDGFLDASLLVLFRPLDQGVGNRTQAELRGAMCTDPVATTACTNDPMNVPAITEIANQDSGVCLDSVVGTTTGYSPAVAAVLPDCFVGDEVTASLSFGGSEIALTSARWAATWVGDPATELTGGLVRGFISESDADQILLPEDLPLVGGQSISLLLPGGTGNCSAGDDRDMHNGEMGWWFYFAFEAERQDAYTGP